MTESITTIIRSARHFFSGTLISRVTGLVRDIAMAFSFGAEPAVAALMVSYRLAHLFRRIFGEGALQSAFVPFFEQIRQQDEEKATHFFMSLRRGLFALLSIGIIVGVLLIFTGLHFLPLSEGNQEILFYLALLLPSLLFICLFGINSALLQCHQQYFTTGVAPVAMNILWALFAVMLLNTPVETAMPFLAIGISIASIAQWLVTEPQVRKITRSISIKKESWITPEMKALGGTFFFAIIGISATQINGAVDAIFARYANSEGPAWLWYAFRCSHLPLALFSVAISLAALPSLSRVANQLPHFRALLWSSLRTSLAFLLPASLFLLLLGGDTVNLLFGHGHFDTTSVQETYKCLAAYSLSLIPASWIALLAPAAYALKEVRTPAKASYIALASNVLLSSWMIFGLGFGPMSVALATSVSAMINTLILIIQLRKSIFPLPKALFSHLLKPLALSCLFSSLLCILAQYSMYEALPISSIFNPYFPYPRDFPSQFTHFVIPSLGFAAPFFYFLLKSKKLFLGRL